MRPELIGLACEGVLFDLDGVLVDSTPSVERSWLRWAARHGLDAEKILAVAHGVRAAETIRAFAPHLDAEAETRVLERAEIEDVTSVVRLPGAEELLHSLPQGSWGIVTSGTRALATARVRQIGLPVPEALVTADDVTNGKPDPACYLAGARLLGVPPERCVVFEDAPAGVRAGRAAGMAVVAVTTTYEAAALSEASVVVRSLEGVSVYGAGGGSGILLRIEGVTG